MSPFSCGLNQVSGSARSVGDTLHVERFDTKEKEYTFRFPITTY